jgi:hypothetical protein
MQINIPMRSRLIITIPHFNNPSGLMLTIGSINESFPIDVIVVDDGSKNIFNERLALSNYQNPGKIFFKYLKENIGVGAASNYALTFAKKNNYTHIGRLDAGDICYKNKFFKQLNFLEKNSNIKLLGSWARAVNNQGKLLFHIKHPINHDEIRKKIYLNSMFVNPTVVFDASILETVKGYPREYSYAAHDYAFYFKVVKKYECANLAEVLLDYVVDENSISSKNRKLQVKNRIRIILDNFTFGIYPVYGLLRSLILYFFSRRFLNYVKSKIN